MNNSLNTTEVTFEANLLCGHYLEENSGELCTFEGDVEYTITLENGYPWGTAWAVCPECGNDCPDEGVVDTYLDFLEAQDLGGRD